MPVRVIFVSGQMLPASWKDVLLAILMSSVIYEYKCHCDSPYFGRISQRLQDRITLHGPKWPRQHTGSQRVQPDQECKRKQTTPERDSAIGQHLLENDQCAMKINFLFWTRSAFFKAAQMSHNNVCREA